MTTFSYSLIKNACAHDRVGEETSLELIFCGVVDNSGEVDEPHGGEDGHGEADKQGQADGALTRAHALPCLGSAGPASHWSRSIIRDSYWLRLAT